jgi:hypothetical protein
LACFSCGTSADGTRKVIVQVAGMQARKCLQNLNFENVWSFLAKAFERFFVQKP